MVRSRRPMALVALVQAAVLVVVLLAGCGSEPRAKDSPSTPTSAPAASVLPTAPTVPGGGPGAAVCVPLATSARVADLQPRGATDWTVERQRIMAATATNVTLYERAAEAAPPDLAPQLAKLAAYSMFVEGAVRSAPDFGTAVDGIAKYPDIVGASMAMAAVDTWRRANCSS